MLDIVRSIVAIAIAAFVLLGPGYRQVLGGKGELIPRWVMFSGKGLGIYGVHFDLVEEPGKTRTVTWGEFDQPRKAGTPFQAARARDLGHIASQAARICRAVGPHAQLFATVRQAVRTGNGWTKKSGDKLDLCVPRNRVAFVGGRARPDDRRSRRGPGR